MPSSPKVFQDETLVPLEEIDLRMLAEMQDETDNYLSIYINTLARDQRIFVSSRLKAMEKALPKDQTEAFKKTMELAEPILTSSPVKGEKGRVIFASAAHGFLVAYRLSLEVQTQLVWDKSPFLLPLARLAEYSDYWLLLIDSREARLFLVRSDLIEERDRFSIDLMNKHKKGGWSQMRFNRLRKGAISSFLSEVASDLAKQADQEEVMGLVVAGPGEAKTRFVEQLSSPLKARLLGSIDASMEIPPAELLKIGGGLARDGEQERSKVLVKTFKDAILKGRPAVYGLVEVDKALREGRVNYLFISSDFALPKMICMSCHHPHETKEKCPSCGGEMAAVKLEEIYDMAERTGVEVVLVQDDDFLASIGHLGAILRY